MLRAAQLAMLLALPTLATAQEAEPKPGLKPGIVAQKSIEDVHKDLDLLILERDISRMLLVYLKDPLAKDAETYRANAEKLLKQYKELNPSRISPKSGEFRNMYREFTRTAEEKIKMYLNEQEARLAQKDFDAQDFKELMVHLLYIEKKILANKLLGYFLGEEDFETIKLEDEYSKLHNSLASSLNDSASQLLTRLNAESLDSNFSDIQLSLEAFMSLHGYAKLYAEYGFEVPEHLKPYQDMQDKLSLLRQSFNSKLSTYSQDLIAAINADDTDKVAAMTPALVNLSAMDKQLNETSRSDSIQNIYDAIYAKLTIIFDELAVAIKENDKAKFDQTLASRKKHYTLLVETLRLNSITDTRSRPAMPKTVLAGLTRNFHLSYKSAYDNLGHIFINDNRAMLDQAFQRIIALNSCYENLELVLGEDCSRNVPYIKANPGSQAYEGLSDGLKQGTATLLKNTLDEFLNTGAIDESRFESLDFNLAVMYILKTQKLLNCDYNELPLQPRLADINFTEVNDYRAKLVDHILDPVKSQSKIGAYRLLLRLEALADKHQVEEDFEPIANLLYGLANNSFSNSGVELDYQEQGKLLAASFRGMNYEEVFNRLAQDKKLCLTSLITNDNRKGHSVNPEFYFSDKKKKQAKANRKATNPLIRRYRKAINEAANHKKTNRSKLRPSQREILRIIRASGGIDGYFGELESMPDANGQRRGRARAGEDEKIYQHVRFQANLAKLMDGFFASLGDDELGQELRDEYNKSRFSLFERKLAEPTPPSEREAKIQAIDEIIEGFARTVDDFHPIFGLTDRYKGSNFDLYADAASKPRKYHDYCSTVSNSAWDARYSYPATIARSLSQYLQYLLKTDDLSKEQKLEKLKYLRDFFCGIDGTGSAEAKDALGYLDYVPETAFDAMKIKVEKNGRPSELDISVYKDGKYTGDKSKFAGTFFGDFYKSIEGLSRSEKGSLLGWMAAITGHRFNNVFDSPEFEKLDFRQPNFDAARRALKN